MTFTFVASVTDTDSFDDPADGTAHRLGPFAVAVSEPFGVRFSNGAPREPDGPGVDTGITSLYHVRREPQFDGTKSLHWAYLGDVHDTAGARCETCGRAFDRGVDVCPNCDSDAIDGGTEA